MNAVQLLYMPMFALESFVTHVFCDINIRFPNLLFLSHPCFNLTFSLSLFTFSRTSARGQ